MLERRGNESTFNIIRKHWMEQNTALSSQKTSGKEANSFSRDFSSKEEAAEQAT